MTEVFSYFRAHGEAMSGETMDQYFEVRGDEVSRQVTHYRDRWLSSLDAWLEPVGMLLTDQPAPPGDFAPEDTISAEEFERAWQRALSQRDDDG